MNLRTSFTIFGLVASCASPVFAGALASDTTSYLSSWNGTTAFQGHDEFGNPSGLVGTVDYAVYTDAQFQANFPGSGFTPANTNDFIYVYQAFETGSAALSSLSVRVVNQVDAQSYFSGINDLGNGAQLVAGQAPSSMTTDTADGFVTWEFPGVLTGGSTAALVFASPFAPILSQGSTIDDGTVGFVRPLPAPGTTTGTPNTPEPGTLTLVLLGVAGLGAYRLRSWKRKAA